jgi:hypothetical protein
MTCPGLHCAGCGRGGNAATLTLTAIAALAAWWAFQDLVAVVVAVAVSFVLALVTVSLLIRATQKREARVGLLLAAQRQATELAWPPRTPHRAVTGDLHLHFHGLPDTAAAAAVIRQAISGPELVSGPAPVSGPEIVSGPAPVSGPEIVSEPEFAGVPAPAGVPALPYPDPARPA